MLLFTFIDSLRSASPFVRQFYFVTSPICRVRMKNICQINEIIFVFSISRAFDFMYIGNDLRIFFFFAKHPSKITWWGILNNFLLPPIFYFLFSRDVKMLILNEIDIKASKIVNYKYWRHGIMEIDTEKSCGSMYTSSEIFISAHFFHSRSWQWIIYGNENSRNNWTQSKKILIRIFNRKNTKFHSRAYNFHG